MVDIKQSIQLIQALKTTGTICAVKHRYKQLEYEYRCASVTFQLSLDIFVLLLFSFSYLVLLFCVKLHQKVCVLSY